jgi:spore maturation protein CgeB
VGNSRKEYRKIVKDFIELGLDISVYGADWEGIIPVSYLKGQYIDNHRLHLYYSNCGVVLNDHWESMKRYGFISNRLFDAAACGAMILTDYVKGVEDIFGNNVLIYKEQNEIVPLLEGFESNYDFRENISSNLSKLVRGKHSFKERTATILKDLRASCEYIQILEII